MKSYLRFNTAIASAACGIALSAGVLSICARADQWDKKTVLTVNQPIQVEETLLQPGKYVLKLLDSSSDRHIVQIFNGDQTHIINTVLAIPNYRLQPTGHSQFMFWETPVLGQAQPVLAKTWRFADRASRDYAAAHLHLN